MTINDALRHRVRFVRLPHWVPTAHIELPVETFGYGPWAIVRDPSGEQHVFIGTLQYDGESGYEAYEPTPATNAVDPSAQPSGTPSARVSSSGSED